MYRRSIEQEFPAHRERHRRRAVDADRRRLPIARARARCPGARARRHLKEPRCRITPSASSTSSPKRRSAATRSRYSRMRAASTTRRCRRSRCSSTCRRPRSSCRPTGRRRACGSSRRRSRCRSRVTRRSAPRMSFAALTGAGDSVTLEMIAGVIPVDARGDTWTLQANPPRTRPVAASRAELAAMLVIAEADVAPDPAAPPLWVDTGVGAARDPARLRRSDSPRRAPRADLLLAHGRTGSARWRTSSRRPPIGPRLPASGAMVVRFFFPKHGAVVEDPGTGSACANLGGWLLATGAPLPQRLSIAQGDAVGRPCRMGLEVERRSSDTRVRARHRARSAARSRCRLLCVLHLDRISGYSCSLMPHACGHTPEVRTRLRRYGHGRHDMLPRGSALTAGYNFPVSCHRHWCDTVRRA